jgi:hypothetical protein
MNQPEFVPGIHSGFSQMTGKPKVIPSQKAYCEKPRPLSPLACVVA